MLWLSILILSLLAVFSYRIGGRAILYPPVVFCGMFAVDLVLVCVAGDLFYPMLPETLFILVCGGFAFSIGSWIGTFLPHRPRQEHIQRPSHTAITVIVAVVVVGLPFYIRWLYGLVSAYRGPASLSFFLLARMSTMDLAGKSLANTLFGTLHEVSIIIALIAFYERQRHAKRAVIAITASLAMGILVGQKVGPLSLIVGLLCIDWLQTRRLRWKLVVAMAFIFAAVTATVEFYVHLGGDSLEEKAIPIVQNFAVYASGGIVGLDRFVREPNVAPPVNQIYPLYLRAVRRLGGHVEVPEVAEFVTIGPNGRTDNVYTTYWSYLELGYAGAVACIGVIGMVLALIYRAALHGNSLWVLLYAVLFRGIVFAAFNDQFLLLYFLFKVVVVWWLVYSWPIRWARFKKLVRIGTEGVLATNPKYSH